MNIAARIVIRFLKPLFHPFQMLTRWNVKSAGKRMWKNRFPHLQAACRAAQIMLRPEPFPAARPNPVSPEHDILGARWPLFYIRAVSLKFSDRQPCFFRFRLKEYRLKAEG